MSGIVWLASYPKSGNTWMRVFLTNYLRDADEPADINRLERTPIASSRVHFEQAVGVESSDLSLDEQDALRPDAYRWLAAQPREQPLMMKVHDAYTYLADGSPLFPPDVTQGAIYILRNPLDVAVSGAAFMGVDVAAAPGAMGDPTMTMCGARRGMTGQLRQRLLTWSAHVTSWLDAPDSFPRLAVRYEDMKRDPTGTFGRVIRFLDLPFERMRLEKAIAFSSFDRLRGQEAASGFREKPRQAARFFRKGAIGSWQDQLTADQSARIIADHQDVMRRFGYLDAADMPIIKDPLQEAVL